MKIINKTNLDELVVKAVDSNYQYTDKRYSVTSILTDYKEIILKRRHHNEMIRDVKDMAWLMFGTAFHEFLEKQEVEWVEVKESVFNVFKRFAKDCKEEWSTNEANGELEPHYYIKPKLKEEHLIYKCQHSDYTLTGYSDLYNLLTNEVIDYKTASVNKVLYGDWDDYIKQLKLYAMMLTSMGFPCYKGRLIVFLKDWSKTAYTRDPKSYPSSPIYQIGWQFTHQDLYDERQWVEDYFLKLADIENLADDELVICNDDVRKFGRKPTFAVMKNENKRATKVFDTETEAFEYIRYNQLDKGKDEYWVKPRPAEDIRCQEYCDSCHWCNHFIKNFASVHLVNNETGKVEMGFKNTYEANEYIETMSDVKDYSNYKLVEIKREKEEE
jgi:hypothetical protein